MMQNDASNEAGTTPMGRPPHAKTPQHPERRVDVALAQFTALRGEISGRVNIQAALVGVALTALGVIFGLALSKEGNPLLLTAVPTVGLAITILYYAEAYRIGLIIKFIDQDLWPSIARQVGDDVPSWEGAALKRQWKRGTVAVAALLDGAVAALLAAASALAIALSAEPIEGAQILNLVAVVLIVVLPVVGAVILRRHHSS